MLLKKPFVSLLLVVCVSLAIPFAADAKSDTLSKQKEFSNSLIFSGTYYSLPGNFSRLATLLFWQDNQVGIYYDRKIYKHFRIKIGFNEWNTMWYNNKPTNNQFVIFPHNDSLKDGDVLTCSNYKMVDIYASYTFNILKRHKINIGIGASYTWGINSVIDSIVAVPGYNDAIIFQGGEKKYYYGIIPTISYDYLCFKNRISLGYDLRYRKYFGFYLNTFEYGFHIGLNF